MSISSLSGAQISMARLNMLTQSASIGQPGQVGQSGVGAGSPARGAGAEGASFGDTLKRALSEVSESQENAQDQVAAFLRGEPVELHQGRVADRGENVVVDFHLKLSLGKEKPAPL